jgi:hypothetical protein
MTARLGLPDLGVGVGLRVPHYRYLLEHWPEMPFFEVISENFLVAGGKPIYHLERFLERYRIVQHGVSLGIGGPAPLDRDYLARLRALVKKVQPPWLSDHFCWCGVPGANLHDLLPLPYTAAAVERIAERAGAVQDQLETRFALENTSSYLSYTSSTMTEWEFVGEIAERADIGLLFDVNNVYVAAYNHGFDPFEFIRSVPHERIVQIHLAGHTNLGAYIIDTHGGHVIDPVLDLYRETIALAGPVSTLIEWDDEIPEFPVLAAEAERVRRVRDEGLRLRAARASGEAPPFQRPAWAASFGAPAADKLVRTPSGHRPWAQGGPRETAAE